jgi:hypothetical protein
MEMKTRQMLDGMLSNSMVGFWLQSAISIRQPNLNRGSLCRVSLLKASANRKTRNFIHLSLPQLPRGICAAPILSARRLTVKISATLHCFPELDADELYERATNLIGNNWGLVRALAFPLRDRGSLDHEEITEIVTRLDKRIGIHNPLQAARTLSGN